MKRFLLAGAALVAMVSASSAADLAAPVEEPVVAPFTWTGFYIGAHGGWGFADSDVSFKDSWGNDWDTGFDHDGFVVGGQLGYNWAWNDTWLIGIEGDASFTDSDDDDDDFLLSSDHRFLASIRGRVGFGFDRFLIFGSGGAAFAGFEMNDDDPFFDDDDDNTFFGWAAGGGFEYAFTDYVSIGVEYLHYEFDNQDFDFDNPNRDDLEADLSVDVVRGRLNVKFDTLFQ
jgi:outer membrane immunogenic protein